MHSGYFLQVLLPLLRLLFRRVSIDLGGDLLITHTYIVSYWRTLTETLEGTCCLLIREDIRLLDRYPLSHFVLLVERDEDLLKHSGLMKSYLALS